jgi:predicted metal-binding membrane protein
MAWYGECWRLTGLAASTADVRFRSDEADYSAARMSEEADRLKQRVTSGFEHARLNLSVALITLTVGAWALTLYQAVEMSAPMEIAVRGGITSDGMGGMAMAGMPAGGWSFAGAITFVALWTVMMAAMMLPAAAPMILIFASAQTQRAGAVVPTWIFVAGYLFVWALAGVLVYAAVQIGSDIATQLTSLERARWAPLALGATLVTAGLYQFTPMKRICLTRCRSPFAFVALYWRDGRLGALRMGMRHGAYCLGCCWALFAVLVAAGVMSLAWMLLLTAVVFVEKVLPDGQRAASLIGLALVGLGLGVGVGAV